MARVAYIGDELSGAGYRLAGARVYLPAGGEERTMLDRACAENELVLVGAACAGRIDPDLLGRLARRGAPIVLVVPDGRGGESDLAAQMRRRIGLQP